MESADAPYVLERKEVATEAVRRTPAGDETYPTGRLFITAVRLSGGHAQKLTCQQLPPAPITPE
ncbi:hypothetical protein ACWWD9_07055 [Methylovorus sp. SPW-M1]